MMNHMAIQIHKKVIPKLYKNQKCLSVRLGDCWYIHAKNLYSNHKYSRFKFLNFEFKLNYSVLLKPHSKYLI